MKNFEQIRAAAALEFWNDPKNSRANEGEDGGKVVVKLPALIINNGLLATVAFARQKRSNYEKIALEILKFLSEKMQIFSKAGDPKKDEFESCIRGLTESSSLVLQRATSEALAYLSYLKRFAPKE